jgi:hypothetical protein
MLSAYDFWITKKPHGRDDGHPLQMKHEAGVTSLVLLKEGHYALVSK